MKKAIHPVGNWGRLGLLGISSFAVSGAFGLIFPFIYTDPPVTPNGAAPFNPSVYPWTYGLIFSVLMAVMFLLCLDDPRQRRAAFAAIGISALLTGPAYVWNAERLAQFAPVSAPWIAPHLPVGLLLLCLGSSAALLVWWLRRAGPFVRQGMMPWLLFFGLILILLVMPWASNRCGIESMRILTALPASADDHRQTKDTLTKFLVQGEAGSVGDVVGFITQWLGLAITALTFLYMILIAGMGRTDGEMAEARSKPFPCRSDLLPLLLLLVGGFLFPFICSLLFGLSRKIIEVEHEMQRHVYPCHTALLTIEILAGWVFLIGSWLVLRRIQTASQLRFGFTLLILIASAFLSILAIVGPHHALKIGGILALILCFAQVAAFFQAKRRAVWISSVFASPGETALSFVLHGSVMLAVVGGALMAIALELAVVSVMCIHYFIEWGRALKPLHGVAPTQKIVPEIAPSLASIQVDLGPVYFSTCLFVAVMAVLLFSLIYWGCQGCAKLYRGVISFLRRARRSDFQSPRIDRLASVAPSPGRS